MTRLWFDMWDAALYLRFFEDEARTRPSQRAAREWIDRHGVPTKRRGRVVVVRPEDLDAALTDRTTRRA